MQKQKQSKWLICRTLLKPNFNVFFFSCLQNTNKYDLGNYAIRLTIIVVLLFKTWILLLDMF